jgi:pimeloyl-ACP methyl ester carboxylesterase
LAEAKKETFDNDGLPIQTYRWDGDEKIIFLLHGWESNTARWKKLIPYLLETGHTIIAIDAPAHGLSEGKEFNVIRYAASINIVAKKYSPNYIIGHSIGGKASLYYQATYNNPTVEKMVLLGAPSDYAIIFKNYVGLLRLSSRMEQLIHQHYWDRFQIKVAEFSAQYYAHSITAKGLLLHDLDDTVVLHDESQKINHYWKASVLETTQGLGHSLQNKIVYKKIVDFLFQ